MEGKYIYGIIETPQDHRFGAVGIQEEEVYTLGTERLAMVVSHYSESEKNYVPSSRENMLAHQLTLEKVMEEYTLLPVKFGTVAANESKIQDLLQRREKEFLQAIREIEGKVELGLKALWKDLPSIFAEIVEENDDIKRLKQKAERRQDQSLFIEIGKMVQEALANKKQSSAESILEVLNPTAVSTKLNANLTDAMYLNASFLVSKGREKEFDNLVEEIGEQYEQKVKFKYVGPLAPYNFVTLNIPPEEWEI